MTPTHHSRSDGGTASTTSADSITLSVTPERALIDEPLDVRVTGVDPGQQVELLAEFPFRETGARGRVTFEADEEGVVDPSEQAPVAGDYEGVRPMGLVEFAHTGIEDVAPDTDASEATDGDTDRTFPLTITARVGGDAVATGTVERVLLPDGVERQRIDDADLVGDIYLPAGDGPHPGVVFFGGSEGGVSDGVHPRLLAAKGYAVLMPACFQPPEAAYGSDSDDDRNWDLLPEEAAGIPLEYVDRAVEWFAGHDGVRAAPLGTVGASIGADLALVTATRHAEVETAVAYAPGGVIMEGISDERGPADALVTEHGESLPHIKYRSFRQFLSLFWYRLRGKPVELAGWWSEGLDDATEEEIRAATVPVEEVGGPVMLLSGGDDRLRDAERFGDLVMEYVRELDADLPVEHHVYDDAGHSLGVPYLPCRGRERTPFFLGLEMALGGTPEGYAQADTDAWPRVLDTLAETLRSD
jgi:dienelactone hydrolase